jgi:ribulose-5-phosphate 4-epimerase/fuculose-1-phosphate aldolase
MIDTNQEGVIKFQLEFQKAAAPFADLLQELNAWRSIFLQLGLIGQDPDRYEGYGFGNLSRRNPAPAENSFLISGTQTGHLRALLPQHYATVQRCNPETNKITASGPIEPSSEALSHGVLYQSCPKIFWVMHLHSPEIFNCRSKLNLPCTDPAAKYGTPQMAEEIKRLAESTSQADPALLVMTGHEDGILAFGATSNETGKLVIETLALARQSC